MSDLVDKFKTIEIKRSSSTTQIDKTEIDDFFTIQWKQQKQQKQEPKIKIEKHENRIKAGFYNNVNSGSISGIKPLKVNRATSDL